jgi:phage terminase large subunit-like protein
LERLSPQEYADKYVLILDQYVNDVIDNKVTTIGRQERQAVLHFVNIYKKKYEYRESELIRCLKFFSLINVSFKGEVVQLQLIFWQVFIIASCYCFFYPNTDKRVVNQAAISTSGKNGKSSFVCGLALFESIADFELNANIAIVSLTNKQSQEILKYCKQMIELSPLLSELFKINHSTIYNKQTKSTNSIIVVTNEVDKIQGMNCSAAILDEIWLYDNLDIMNIALKKMSTRKNPIQFLVGTFSNKDSYTYQNLYLPCLDILEGSASNDSLFIYFFQQDSTQEVDLPATWAKSNPSLGRVQSIDELVNEYDQMKIFPSRKRTFLSDSLNFWNETSLNEIWIEDELIVANMKARKVLPVVAGNSRTPVWIGLDISTNTDLSSISVIGQVGQDLVCKTINVMPDCTRNFKKKNVDLSKWFVKDIPAFMENSFLAVEKEDNTECVIPCSTPVLDEDLIYDIITALSKQFRVISVGYDQYNSHQIIFRLEESGIKCDPVRQNATTLSFPLKYMEKLLIENKLFFELNPSTRYMASNINVYSDSNGNIKLMKNKEKLPIDAWVATNIAMVEHLKDIHHNPNLALTKFLKELNGSKAA